MPKNEDLRNERYLWIALGLTTTFIGIELMGALYSKSLALLSDAAHLLTDAAALVISIAAMRFGRREPDAKRTYGYYRFEILAAAFNAIILFLVAFFIFLEAYKRLFTVHAIHTSSMLVVASCGFLINLLSVELLRVPSQQSLNIKSAYIDAQADMWSSLGIIITAGFIHFTGWQYVDSIMAIAIALWILPRTWTLLKESINILLEGVPEGIELADIHKALSSLAGVIEVHDIHVWALTNKKISLTAHVVVQPTIQPDDLLRAVGRCLADGFQITHSTIQIEHDRCSHQKGI